jgi:hypothetical protein
MGVAVVLVPLALAPVVYLGMHKYRVEHGEAGLPGAQQMLEKIDASAGTTLAPKGAAPAEVAPIAQ